MGGERGSWVRMCRVRGAVDMGGGWIVSTLGGRIAELARKGEGTVG